MSSSQLVILTSLVALFRGLYNFQPNRIQKKRMGWAFIFLFAGVVVGLYRFFRFQLAQQGLQNFFNWGYDQSWIQNNFGTFVFWLGCLGLILFFFATFAKEWNVDFLRGINEWFDPFILAGAIALILITYIARTYYIPSESMEPTLMVHDYIVVAKPFLLRLFHDFPPQRGDIVVFHPPLPGETREFIKRVIGLPLETFAVKRGKVTINDKPLNEPYIETPPDYLFGPVKIPPGHYIVLGDNRTNSEDSHAWPDVGATPFLSLARIEGRAVFIFFPPTRFHLLHDYNFFQAVP